MKSLKKFALFSGRHPLPENEGAFYREIDFGLTAFDLADRLDQHFNNEVFTTFVNAVNNGHSVGVYVTGYTPALIDFMLKVKTWMGAHVHVSFMHYNPSTKNYDTQYWVS